MSTRAASAANAGRVKKKLVRLLFGRNDSKTSPRTISASAAAVPNDCLEQARKLDPFAYSYTQLRTAYLEKLQVLHPDKHRCQHVKSSVNDQFVELQHAWDQYEEIAKLMKQGEEIKQSNFTMFGVGCSFSDNEEERAMRNEITDQACRGWFSSGALASTTTTTTTTHKEENKSHGAASPNSSVSLADEDMFVPVIGNPTTHESTRIASGSSNMTRGVPSLVANRFYAKKK